MRGPALRGRGHAREDRAADPGEDDVPDGRLAGKDTVVDPLVKTGPGGDGDGREQQPAGQKRMVSEVHSIS